MLKIPQILLAGALWSATPLYAQSAAPIPQTARAPVIAGLRREAGAWLFNDSIFASPGENRGPVGGPVFVSNLRRDKKNKLPLFMPAKTGVAVRWATLPLPDLRQMSAPGFDFAALQAQLTAQVGAARAAGQVYVGWSLPTVNENERESNPGSMTGTLDKTKVAATLKQLRAVLDAVAPESALILQVGTPDSQALPDIDVAAPLCDAVVLTMRTPTPEALWPLKMARRVAEEQPDYDLPIFVALSDPAVADLPLLGATQGARAVVTNQTASDARLLEFWMGGATGFVLPNAQVPAWSGVISRNAGLISGAVTLEDAAVLPSPNSRSLALVNQLRAAGRVPLVGRLPDDAPGRNSRGESLLALLDDSTTLETLNGLDKAARSGNSVYLEGVPDLRTAALLAKLSDMTSTTLEILPAPKSEVMTLDDAWLFGDARGREIGVTQRVKWTIKTSLAAQARKKPGEDVLEAMSAAKLAGDENGLLVAPLGKGRILWLAHTPTNTPADEAARRDYYGAIAGNLQGGLAELSFDSVEDAARNGNRVRFALRSSKASTPIVALFNDAPTDATVTLSARGDSPLALDLIAEREIAAQVSGYTSSVKITVPAHGFSWLTFGATRAALDKERLAARPKAKTR